MNVKNMGEKKGMSECKKNPNKWKIKWIEKKMSKLKRINKWKIKWM